MALPIFDMVLNTKGNPQIFFPVSSPSDIDTSNTKFLQTPSEIEVILDKSVKK